MEMSRRNVLRGAAVVGGAAASVPLIGSLSESAIAAGAASTTVDHTWTFGPANAKGYQKLVPGPGEARSVRTGLSAGPTSSPSPSDPRAANPTSTI